MSYNFTLPNLEAERRRELEAQAEALLSRCDNSPAWAREWADLHDRWGVACFGFPTWAAWAEDVAAGSGCDDAEARAR